MTGSLPGTPGGSGALPGMPQPEKNISPELAQRLRPRRPGYDRVYTLVQKYSESSHRHLARMTEDQISKDYIQPMFQALGWSVQMETVSQNKFPLFDLEYQNLRIPVEIKKFDDPIKAETSDIMRRWRGVDTWGILTNFENIQIWDIDHQSLVLETSPWAYIADDNEEDDLLAATIFYERLVQPPTQRIEVSGQIDPTGELEALKIPEPGFDSPVGSKEERSGDTIWPNSWIEILSFLSPLPEAPGNFSPGVRLTPNQINSKTYEVYAPANGTVTHAQMASTGWFGTIIIESILPDQTHVFARISQLDEIIVNLNDQVVRGQLIGRIAFNQPDKFLRYEIAKSEIQPYHWEIENPQIIEQYYLNPTEFTQANRHRRFAQLDATLGPVTLAATATATAGVTVTKTGEPTPESTTTTVSETHSIEIAIRALADKPSDVDLLGFTDYAEALADFIKEPKTEKPLTIGIDAAWGMGKTTLMKMLQQRLAGTGRMTWGRQSFPTIWFNAWKYDEEESLWAALVLEILGQIRRQLTWWQRTRLSLQLNWKRFDWGLLWQKILKYLVIYVFLVGILGTLTFGIASLWLGATWQESWQKLWQYIQLVGGLGFLTAIYAAGKQVFDSLTNPFNLKLEQYIRQPNYAERVGFLAQFEADFKRVIDVVTEEGKWPLIVFIDDLDRCAPPKPVEIIEAINLLLDSQYCVFILGMDAQTVAGSIEAKYKDLLEKLVEDDAPGSLTLGQRFLEKIIQINFRIPKVDPDVMASFVDAHLTSQAKEAASSPVQVKVAEAENLIKAEQRGGITSRDEAAEVVQKARPDLSPDVIAAAKEEVHKKSFDDSVEVKQAIHEAVRYLGFNPRKIKRFINLLRLQALIANRRGLLDHQVIQLDMLGKWLLLATLWPDTVEAIAADQSFVGRLQGAYATQEELRKRLSEATAKQRKDLARLVNEEIKVIEVSLNNYLADPLIKQLINTPKLIQLLAGIDMSKPEVFSQYLRLAQIGVDSSAKQQLAQGDIKQG